MSKSCVYKAGYDCGFTMSNATNCHFSLFSSQERMREWYAGYCDGCKDRNMGRPRACEMDAPLKDAAGVTSVAESFRRHVGGNDNG